MAETNTAARRAQGGRDARALNVTGRGRADTGRIRRAAKALARMARTVTPETPNGQWLRDNRSFAAAAPAAPRAAPWAPYPARLNPPSSLTKRSA